MRRQRTILLCVCLMTHMIMGPLNTSPIFAGEHGRAIISGSVTLPVSEKSGSLYVIAWRRCQSPPWFFWTKLSSDKIKSSKSEYRVANLLPGDYNVTAFWDVAAPFTNIGNPEASVGDYLGAFSAKRIAVKSNETIHHIDFECSSLLRSPDDYGKQYQITDLTFQKADFDDYKFYLRVRNTGIKFIGYPKFDFIINGIRLPDFTLFQGKKACQPGKEKEFDMTRVYNAYIRSSRKDKKKLSTKKLYIKVISRDNEGIFEKSIYLD